MLPYSGGLGLFRKRRRNIREHSGQMNLRRCELGELFFSFSACTITLYCRDDLSRELARELYRREGVSSRECGLAFSLLVWGAI